MVSAQRLQQSAGFIDQVLSFMLIRGDLIRRHFSWEALSSKGFLRIVQESKSQPPELTSTRLEECTRKNQERHQAVALARPRDQPKPSDKSEKSFLWSHQNKNFCRQLNF